LAIVLFHVMGLTDNTIKLSSKANYDD